MSWLAYVDESIRTDDGVYVLAAVALDPADVARVRGAICAAEGNEPAYRDLLAGILTEHRIRLS